MPEALEASVGAGTALNLWARISLDHDFPPRPGQYPVIPLGAGD